MISHISTRLMICHCCIKLMSLTSLSHCDRNSLPILITSSWSGTEHRIWLKTPRDGNVRKKERKKNSHGSLQCNISASPRSTLLFHVSLLGYSTGLQISIFSPFIPAVTHARLPTQPSPTAPPQPSPPCPCHGLLVRRGRLIILWSRSDLFHQCEWLQLITDEMDLIWTLTAGQTPAQTWRRGGAGEMKPERLMSS